MSTINYLAETPLEMRQQVNNENAMNQDQEQIADGIWANLSLREKVELLEKAGWTVKSEEDMPREKE